MYEVMANLDFLLNDLFTVAYMIGNAVRRLYSHIDGTGTDVDWIWEGFFGGPGRVLFEIDD